MPTERECVDLDLTKECCKVLILLKKHPEKFYKEHEIYSDYDGPRYQTLDDNSEVNKGKPIEIEEIISPCLTQLIKIGLVEQKGSAYCYSRK